MQMSRCSSPGCKQATETIALFISAHEEVSEKAYCRNHTQLLGFEFDVPDPRRLRLAPTASPFAECRLRAVIFHKATGLNLVLLRAPKPGNIFVFPTGFIEASCIYNLAKSAGTRQHSTHALVASAIESLGGSLIESTVAGYNIGENRYECSLLVRLPKDTSIIPCRASDAVGVSLASGIPIKVHPGLLIESRGLL